jgi:hypothetical protein
LGLLTNYHGFATRGLADMMRLGFAVYAAARTVRPAVQSVLLIHYQCRRPGCRKQH